MGRTLQEQKGTEAGSEDGAEREREREGGEGRGDFISGTTKLAGFSK